MHARVRVIGICFALVGLGVFVPQSINLLFDLFDIAFGWAGSFWVVTLISALVGILFLMAFPHVSSQRAIVAVKDRIKFNLLAIRLFPDELGNVFGSTAKTLFWNLAYLGLNLLPMLVLAAPFMIVWFQLNSLYAFQPVPVGQSQQIVVELDKGTSPQEIVLSIPEELELSSRVNIDDAQSPILLIDIIPNVAGSYPVNLSYKGTEVVKNIEVATTPRRLARLKTAEPLTKFVAAQDPMVYFGDPILPRDSFVQTITVDYAPAPFGFMGGGEIDIMIWVVVISMAVGFGLKGAFGVEI